jgi:hypothetical protein
LNGDVTVKPQKDNPSVVDISYVHGERDPHTNIPLSEAIANLGLVWEASDENWRHLWKRLFTVFLLLSTSRTSFSPRRSSTSSGDLLPRRGGRRRRASPDVVSF